MAVSDVHFTVSRHAAELVRPTCQAPHGILYLSNLDDQPGIRLHVSHIQFYGCNNTRHEDPAKVIKEALAKVLVHFYPLAGRLRPSPVSANKLLLHCTGEGVSFVEADADVSLRHFFNHNSQLIPPFHCVGKLFADIRRSTSIVDSPLIFIQVTRLTCGGFIIAMRFNHCVSDAIGFHLFLRALAEMAKGADAPSIPPVWERERLLPRSKPYVQFPHYEYTQDSPADVGAEEEMIYKIFVFSSKDIALLKREAGMTDCTTFDVLTAYLWRVRTKALKIPDHEVVRLMFNVGFRSRLQPPLPLGYYGNAFTLACAHTTAAALINNALSFAIKFVQNAKATVNEEYVRSAIDLIELRRSPPVERGITSLTISDVTRVRFNEIDFGWGKALYGGSTTHTLSRRTSLFLPVFDRNSGEEAIAVPLCLPTTAMQVIEADILKLTMRNRYLSTPTPAIRSSM